MPDLPEWFDKDLQKQNERSAKQERRRAKEIGGRVTPGSGSSRRAPQDVRNDDYLESIKYTDKASYILKVKDIIQLRNDAARSGRSGRMVVEFSKQRVTVVIEEI